MPSLDLFTDLPTRIVVATVLLLVTYSHAFTALVTRLGSRQTIVPLQLAPLDISTLLVDHQQCSLLLDQTQLFLADSDIVFSNSYWENIVGNLITVFAGQAAASVGVFIVGFIARRQVKNFIKFIVKQNLVDKILPQRPPLKQVPGDGSKTAPNIDLGKLVLSILIDTAGTSSNLLPIVGEILDVGFAPLSAFTLRKLYKGSNVVFALEFIEEILPFTDIIPLATILWFIDTFAADSEIAKLLKIGNKYEKAIETTASVVSDKKALPKKK